MTMTFRQALKHINACTKARRWVARFFYEKKPSTAKEYWDACKEPAWMLWLIDEIHVPAGRSHAAEITADEVWWSNNVTSRLTRSQLRVAQCNAIHKTIPWKMVEKHLYRTALKRVSMPARKREDEYGY